MSDKKKNKDKVEFDREAFKKGIAAVESAGWNNPYLAIPRKKDGSLASSAAGKYQFRWKHLKRYNPELLKGITKEDFLNNPELQELVMDYAIDNKLKNYNGYLKNAADLTKEYKELLGNKWNYRPDEVAMLTHFLGRQGARNYLKSVSRGSEYKVANAENNLTVEKYLEKYNKALGRNMGIPKKIKKQDLEKHKRNLKLDSSLLEQPKDKLNFNLPERIMPEQMQPVSRAHMPGHYEMPSANVGMNVIQNPQPAQTQPKEEEKTHWLQQSNDFLDQYLANNKFALGGSLTEPDPKKPKEKKQVTSEEEKAIFDYITRQDMQSRSTGTMRPSDPKQGLIDKTIDALASPLTSAKHLIKDGSIPDNMLRGERNALDYSLDLINPFSYIDSGRNLVDATKEGDVIKGGLNLLGLIPMSKNIGKLKVKGQPLKKHWKDSKYKVEIDDYLKAEYERLNSPEGRKRLKKLGLDPEKTLEDFKNNLKFKHQEDIGSYYRARDTFEDDTDVINFDYNQFPELKEYNISPSGVAAHEIGHFLQSGRHRNIKNKEFINYLEAVKNKDVEALKSKYLYPSLIKKYVAEPTKIDDDLLSLTNLHNAFDVYGNNKAFDNYNYFKYGKEGLSGNAKLSVERLPFLRELRQQMVEGKYIKNAYDKIGKAELEKFLKENPKNRIASFLDNSPENKVKLLNNLKYLPAVGALTVGANKAKEKNNEFSQGGNLDPDPYPKKKRDSILNANKHIPWVNRVLNPELNKGKEVLIPGQKNTSTHFTTVGEADGKYYVYPTVFDTGKEKFEYLGDKAFDYAMKNKSAIQFKNEKDALEFSKNYKTEKFKNYYSQGGNLNTNNMLNEDLLTEFNNGGSHEMNPLGGIPMGMGANGQPNLVEQGETREGDYVFSDRLVITKEIAEQFKLPKGTVGKTVAEASKKINDFSKESNSKIDKETTKENLERLKAANENLKKEKMFQEIDSTIRNEFEEGGFMDFVDSGGMGAATGIAGMIGDKIGGSAGNIIGGAAKGAQMGAALGPWGAVAGGLIGGGLQAFQKDPNIEKNKNAALSNAAQVNSQFANGGKMYKLANGGNLYADGGDLFGALKKIDTLKRGFDGGFGGGSFIGGGASGTFEPVKTSEEKFLESFHPVGFSKSGKKSGSEFEDSLKQLESFGTSEVSPFSIDYNSILNRTDSRFPTSRGRGPLPYFPDPSLKLAVGDRSSRFPGMDKDIISKGNALKERKTAMDSLTPAFGASSINKINAYEEPNFEMVMDPEELDAIAAEDTRLEKEGIQALKDQRREKLNSLLGKAERGLRYAPALMNAIQLATMKKPEVESLDRIGTRFKPSYVDENQLINLINEQYGGLEGAIANASAGSTAAMRKNLLASGLNKTKAISDAFMKAEGVNRQQDVMGQQFNLGIDKFNIGQSNQEKDWNARNRAMYDANKSRFMSAIGQDLGNIGLEAIRRKYPELMGMNYNSFGEFVNDYSKWREDNKNKKG